MEQPPLRIVAGALHKGYNMPETPDELQYFEQFKIRHESDIEHTLDRIIANDNEIKQFQVLYIESDVYNPFRLYVLYRPLTEHEKDERMAEHLRKFGKTLVTE
jgi:hypothetical protein